MRYLALLYGMTKRSFITFFRYKFDAAVQLGLSFVLLFSLFLGAKTLLRHVPHADAATLPAIIVGSMVWMLAMMAMGSLAGGLIDEARTGTLEQLAMSPFGLRQVLVAQFASSIALGLGVTGGLLVLMMAATGRWLHFDVISLLPFVLLTIASVLGLGFALGGCALVFKRVQAIVGIMPMILVALIAAPVQRLAWLRYLPLSFGTYLIRSVMVQGKSITSTPPGDVLFLVAHAAGWLALGLLLFGRFERAARARALLGHY